MSAAPAAAHAQTMPARGHSTAPKFDPTQPRELRRYFDEIELQFARCNVTDGQDKKRFARHYVDIDTAALWDSIPETDGASTWAQYKTAIIALYPRAAEDRKWNVSDVDKLIGEHLHIGIHNLM